MEENNYFNYGIPSQNIGINGTQKINSNGQMSNDNGIFSGNDDNIISRWWNPARAEQAEFERENYMMDKGNAFNEYMFNKANEYNSAAEQMKRAKEAGINPMLAAAGIAGAGATAQPMQSQSAGVGMNTNSNSPFDMANNVANTIETLTGTTDKLGKLIGFGKENKLNMDIARNTAKKLAQETKKTFWERKQIEKTFKAFIRLAEANANQAEQLVKNLEKQFDLYQSEIDLNKEKRNLTEEQTETQKEITEQERYKKWEMQFKDTFRKNFGVVLNDSDTSMFVQMILSGHGEEVVKALKECLQSLGRGLKDLIPELPSIKIPEIDLGEKTNINGNNGRVTKVSNEKWEKDLRKEIKYKYDHLNPRAKQYWEKRGGFEEYYKVKRLERLEQ